MPKLETFIFGCTSSRTVEKATVIYKASADELPVRAVPVQGQGLGFRISDFGFGGLGSGFKTSDLGFGV